MNWFIYTLFAAVLLGGSDVFRKFASNLKDPFFGNLAFQLGAISTAVTLFLFFSRKIEHNPKDFGLAFIGGMMICLFSFFTIKAIAIGPGLSTIQPILRTAGMIIVVVLSVILFREKVSLQGVLGIILSIAGIALLYTSK